MNAQVKVLGAEQGRLGEEVSAKENKTETERLLKEI